MRREIRKKDDDLNIKIIKYIGITIGILAIILVGLLMYSKNLNDEVKEGTLSSEQIANILNRPNVVENTESASIEIGRTVNEMKNELVEDEKISNNSNVLNTNSVKPTVTQKKNIAQNKSEEKEEKIEINFEKPVDGEIVRDFAAENLIYSETLQEWTTHPGIDIKADKTTIVKAAEAGTVKSIKNDPRYGLTIIIEHANGFQTVYANLLTSEFVVEGEKIEKGQSIGTVGNSAAFEIADEPHLHFEILKDNALVNPNIYLK